MQNPAPGPLVVTADERLVGAVARAAAAASVVPAVQRDGRSLLSGWVAASVVLIGSDQVAALAEQTLPRRAQVYVLCAAHADQTVLRDALRCGATAVLELPADEVRLVDLLTDSADGSAALGRLIGVVGGAGGAGATTFAAALGTVLAEAVGSALVIDADCAGGGIDQVLGLHPGDGVRWDALGQASGRLSARSLRETLPSVGGVSVVAWPAGRGTGLSLPALRTVLSAGRRGYPAVVVDLPRAVPVVLEEVLPRCDQVLVVSTVTIPALAACLQLTARLPAPGTAAILRGRGGFEAAQVERLLGIPVWHRMSDQRGLDEGIGLGLGPLRARRGPLARAARLVAADIEAGRSR